MSVITGASGAAQLEENLKYLEEGPLPEELVKAFDKGWAIVKRNLWVVLCVNIPQTRSVCAITLLQGTTEYSEAILA